MYNKHMNNQKIQPQTLKGFRDFLPEKAIKRNYLKDKIREVFELYGYDPLETPALEYLEIFQGQIGEDEKLFFKFQDQGNRLVALRFDQTVPTARVIAQYPDKITLPFKRYQIQLAWRAEKPQKGRYREFIQCDADIFGIEGPEADAEVISLGMDIYKSLGFKEIRCLINDRVLYENIPYPVITSIDKLKKIGRENVIKEIIGKGFNKVEAENYFTKVSSFQPTEKIKIILDYLKKAGFPDSWYQFEPTLARSFSYSTGPIWEIEIPGFDGGSVLGGERYDKLVGKFSGKDIPATGFGLGFDRTLEAAEELNLLPIKKTAAFVLVTIFSKDLLNKSLEITSLLRQAKINTEIYTDPSVRLDKQLKYADKKGIPFVIIIGPEEAEKEKLTIKNMLSKSQSNKSVEEFILEVQKSKFTI